MNPMSFTSRSTVWLSRYFRLEFEILKMFPDGFYNTTVYLGQWVWYNRSLKDLYFLRHFMIILKPIF